MRCRHGKYIHGLGRIPKISGINRVTVFHSLGGIKMMKECETRTII